MSRLERFHSKHYVCAYISMCVKAMLCTFSPWLHNHTHTCVTRPALRMATLISPWLWLSLKSDYFPHAYTFYTNDTVRLRNEIVYMQYGCYTCSIHLRLTVMRTVFCYYNNTGTGTGSLRWSPHIPEEERSQQEPGAVPHLRHSDCRRHEIPRGKEDHPPWPRHQKYPPECCWLCEPHTRVYYSGTPLIWSWRKCLY